MNSIVERQNQEPYLQRLLAQRRLYSRAKLIHGIQLVAAVPGAVIWSVLVLRHPDLKVYAGLWGMVVTLADLFLFTPWQQRLKDLAARVQESIDCALLDLQWQDITVGPRPAGEAISEWGALKAGESYDQHKLKNWYPVEIGGLDISYARAICQRTNCWWDARLRRKYAAWWIAVVVFLGLAGLVAGVYFRQPLDGFMFGFALPFLPVLLLGSRQFTEQRQAADRLEKLKQQVDRQWEQLLGGRATGAEIAESARRVQDVLFEQRRKNPVVLDTFYGLLRNRHEQLMSASASDLVREVTEKRGH